MKISYNPITAEALTTAPDNNDITFDLSGLNIFVKGVRFRGTDTTYKIFKKYNSSNEEGYDGLVPAPSYSPINLRYLREDGTWQVPSSSGQSYILLENIDLDTLKIEGMWYYSPSNSSNTNCPDGFNDGAELYIGKNSDNHNYQKVILYDGTVWFRIFDGENWNVWTRQYSTDENVSQILDTSENFRPIVLGYTNSNDTSQFTDITQKVYTNTSIYAQPSTGSLWANMLYSQGKPVLVEHQSLEDYVTLTTAQTITGSKTFTSPINSIVVSETYLGGNQGKAIINSLSNAGSYTMLFKGNSINGYFTQGIYEGTYLLQYTAKSTVDEETNDVTYSVHLLDESGNSLFPGNVRASGTISGNILESRVETGTSPLNIASTTLVTNLNADLLDGKHYHEFLYNASQNYGNSDDVRNIPQWSYFSGNAMENAPTSSDWFSGIVMAANYNPNYKSILGFDVQGNLYTSRSNNGVWYEWKTVAYTTSNVASASQVKVSQHTTNNTNYPVVWSNQNNTNTGNSDLFKSWDHLYYNPAARRLTVSGGVTSLGTIRIKCTSSNYQEGITIQNADSQWCTIRLGSTADAGTSDNTWSIHRTNNNNFSISRNSSNGANGLSINKSGSVGLGYADNAIPGGYRLAVNGSLYSGGDIIMGQNGSTGVRQVRIQCGDNDYGRIAAGATASNAGWMEIASADDGNEPIYVRQYTGVFSTLKRTLTLLDGSGNTSMPGSLSVTGTTTSGNFNTGGRYISNYSSGTWINSVSNSVLTCNYSGYGGILCAPIKSGRITLSTYPSNDNTVYLGYASSSQISAGTNAFNRQARWSADNGYLYVDGFVKNGSSDSYVLLGGGGHTTLSGLYTSHNHFERSNVDPNSIVNGPRTYETTNTANRPDTNTWHQYTTLGTGDGGYCHQLSYAYAGGTNIYHRVKNNGSWGGWITILDTYNYAGILDNRYRKVGGTWKASTCPGTREFGFVSNNGAGEVSFSYDTARGGVLNMSIDGDIYCNDAGYRVWHEGNDGNFFKNRDYINNTSLDTFSSRNSGTYTVGYSGYSGLLSVFKYGSGSVSAMELYAPHYDISWGLRYRLAIDNNRYTGWRDFVFTDSPGLIKYWAIYSLHNNGSNTKKSGNYNFISSSSKRSTGRFLVRVSFPSGYNGNNTIMIGQGVLNNSFSSPDSLLYVTMGAYSGNTYYVNTGDDSTHNDGDCNIIFLCL